MRRTWGLARWKPADVAVLAAVLLALHSHAQWCSSDGRCMCTICGCRSTGPLSMSTWQRCSSRRRRVHVTMMLLDGPYSAPHSAARALLNRWRRFQELALRQFDPDRSSTPRDGFDGGIPMTVLADPQQHRPHALCKDAAAWRSGFGTNSDARMLHNLNHSTLQYYPPDLAAKVLDWKVWPVLELLKLKGNPVCGTHHAQERN